MVINSRNTLFANNFGVRFFFSLSPDCRILLLLFAYAESPHNMATWCVPTSLFTPSHRLRQWPSHRFTQNATRKWKRL